MDGKQVVLNDGTILADGVAGYSDGFLWVWFTGYTMQAAATMFFDPEKTERIVFQYGEMVDEYEGFTVCRSLMIDADGKVSVCMVKGDSNV